MQPSRRRLQQLYPSTWGRHDLSMHVVLHLHEAYAVNVPPLTFVDVPQPSACALLAHWGCHTFMDAHPVLMNTHIISLGTKIPWLLN
ncbi:hypothetical protein OPQ81_011276 [Rhizoctonia solani]|nr:hypothetical protein OPQ81_011276 [Rhizoctonia solani]